MRPTVLSSSVRQSASTHSEQRKLCYRCVRVQRLFSTTPVTHVVAPESPRFIRVPQPPQPTSEPKARVKGFLPVPRKIFSPSKPSQGSPEYLAAATQEPQTSPQLERRLKPTGPVDDGKAAQLARSEWKRQLASTRRRNLREGLVELHERKKRADRMAAARSARQQAERTEAVYRAQREDERLTSPTIAQSVKEQLQARMVQDADRDSRIAQMIANVQATAKKQSEKRIDALHTLYMNARHFITTEEALNKKIEELFVERSREWSTTGFGENVWQQGPPASVQDMLEGFAPDGTGFSDDYTPLTQERLERIGKELTR